MWRAYLHVGRGRDGRGVARYDGRDDHVSREDKQGDERQEPANRASQGVDRECHVSFPFIVV
jgi:hypothetical protein